MEMDQQLHLTLYSWCNFLNAGVNPWLTNGPYILGTSKQSSHMATLPFDDIKWLQEALVALTHHWGVYIKNTTRNMHVLNKLIR